MFFRRGLLISLSLSIFIILGLTTYVSAQSVTVTIGVGDTALRVNGQTSPNAFVTIRDEDTVIGTVTANDDGTYTKLFPAQTPGVHKLNLSARSMSGLLTDTVTVHLSVIEQSITTVEVFLPTTLSFETTRVKYGEPLMLSGETLPFSTVKVFMDDTEFRTTRSDASGNWDISISTQTLTEGKHTFFVRIMDDLGGYSYPTTTNSFVYGSPPYVELPAITQPVAKTVRTPIILFPNSGIVWNKPEISVRGTSDANTQIEVWDDERLLGSAWSNGVGDWSMQLLLESRKYSLRARACFMDQCSGFSSITSFTYRAAQEPLHIKLSKASYVVSRGEVFNLESTILGGVSPYDIVIQWGDGARALYVIDDTDTSFSHAYSKPGQYTISLEATDNDGRVGRTTVSLYVRDNPAYIPPTIIPVVAALALLFPLLRVSIYRHYRLR